MVGLNLMLLTHLLRRHRGLKRCQIESWYGLYGSCRHAELSIDSLLAFPMWVDRCENIRPTARSREVDITRPFDDYAWQARAFDHDLSLSWPDSALYTDSTSGMPYGGDVRGTGSRIWRELFGHEFASCYLCVVSGIEFIDSGGRWMLSCCG